VLSQQQWQEGLWAGKEQQQGPLLLAAWALVEVQLPSWKQKGLVVGMVAAAVEVAMLLSILTLLLVMALLVVLLLLRLAQGTFLRGQGEQRQKRVLVAVMSLMEVVW
jgi:hypothetical protein